MSVPFDPAAYAALHQLAQAAHKSGLFRKFASPEAMFAAMAFGLELGLPPMIAAQGIHVIEGTPSLSARLLQVLLHRSGYELRWEARTDTEATLTLTRDGQSHTVRYTVEDAKKAGLLGKKQWQSQPRAMLTARALSEAVSSYAADAVGGANLYTEEETRDFTDAPERPMLAHTATPERPALTHTPAAFDRSAALAALAALDWPESAVVSALGQDFDRAAAADLLRRARGGERPAVSDDVDADSFYSGAE